MVAVPAIRVGDFVPGPPSRGVSLRPGVKTTCLIDAASKVCGVSLCVADAKAHVKKTAERIILVVEYISFADSNIQSDKSVALPAQLAAAHEHDLARHASLSEQLLSLSRLGNRKSLRDQGLNLLLMKEVEQSDQVLSK